MKDTKKTPVWYLLGAVGCMLLHAYVNKAEAQDCYVPVDVAPVCSSANFDYTCPYNHICTKFGTGVEQACVRYNSDSSDCDDYPNGYLRTNCVVVDGYREISYELAGVSACPIGSEYDPTSGGCRELSPVCLCDVDGHQLQAGYDLGYFSCDRPALEDCGTGDFVLADEAVCPEDCNDAESCLAEACSDPAQHCPTGGISSILYSEGELFVTCGTGNLCDDNTSEPTINNCTDYDTCLQASCNESCSSGYVSGFIYSSPGNFQATCSETGNVSLCGVQGPTDNTDVDSPPVEDLFGTEPGQYQTVDSGSPTLPAANTEEAIAEQTDTLESGLAAIANNQASQGAQITDAISQGAESADENSANIVDAIDRARRQSIVETGSIVDAINALGNGNGNGEGGTGPCDQSAANYFQCITDYNVTVAYQGGGITAAIGALPVVQALTVTTSSGGSDCPALDMSATGYDASTTLHCQLLSDFETPISVVMLFAWSLIGIRTFMEA